MSIMFNDYVLNIKQKIAFIVQQIDLKIKQNLSF